jgi:hypothetical protein
MRRILKHQAMVEAEISKLSLQQKTLFFCSICQRQQPVYEHYSKGQQWANPRPLRVLLEQCWDWSIFPDKFKKPKEPDPVDFITIEYNQSSSGLACEAFSSVQYLIYLINHSANEDVAPPVEYAFNILDSYLYQKLSLTNVSSNNDYLVDSHRLVSQEIARQLETLKMVSRLLISKSDWKNYREVCSPQNLLNLSTK